MHMDVPMEYRSCLHSEIRRAGVEECLYLDYLASERFESKQLRMEYPTLVFKNQHEALSEVPRIISIEQLTS